MGMYDKPYIILYFINYVVSIKRICISYTDGTVLSNAVNGQYIGNNMSGLTEVWTTKKITNLSHA